MTTKCETPRLGASAVLLALHLPTGLGHTVGELRYDGRNSGRHIALPVSYVRTGDSVVVRVGNAAPKTWWRNFRSPHAVSIRVRGDWLTGSGHLVEPGSMEYEEVEAIYENARPRTPRTGTDPYVVIEPVSVASRTRGSKLWRRWFSNVTPGEFLGFAAPAVAGALTVDARAFVIVSAMLLAGAIEGGVLGSFQARVLRTVLSGLRIRDWVTATAAECLRQRISAPRSMNSTRTRAIDLGILLTPVSAPVTR
ncbi:nitroreductase/quinone reductase family protein [Nocardia seriolae]|uniref:DUF385 domain-containing protein n=1 Tax=Nocardia seriolae TaxID=37332 RepID=A0ABC8AWB3_9NOCA|nr:nitroreductase/quinone reductase family protein [Nocardia seriolae]APA98351.1 hypothetical protein NS506_04303 [Nocardia seriolae]MTJ63022.1 DUF385 domain-containing protein [Nocardia seriolae]MTJ74919.1 DUF385 domain-containing protein [Nocardia seriolae]MTJ88047.1 DUF385 domain-containing protein [Nocardia seriolae]MTK32037.1 DUF385 domain-containing protein [Nocardia seriolae]